MSALKDVVTADTPKIGEEIAVSDWVTITQDMIDTFGTTTLDEQWIHMDPERAAKESPFGGPIAHGFLTLSLASHFLANAIGPYPGQVMGVNYGFDKIRFVTPVPEGARVRGRFTLKAMKPRSDTQLLREVQLSVEIEGHDKPAMVADWLGIAVFEG